MSEDLSMSYADFLFLLALGRTRDPWVNAMGWWPFIRADTVMARLALEGGGGVFQWT